MAVPSFLTPSSRKFERAFQKSAAGTPPFPGWFDLLYLFARFVKCAQQATTPYAVLLTRLVSFFASRTPYQLVKVVLLLSDVPTPGVPLLGERLSFASFRPLDIEEWCSFAKTPSVTVTLLFKALFGLVDPSLLVPPPVAQEIPTLF